MEDLSEKLLLNGSSIQALEEQIDKNEKNYPGSPHPSLEDARQLETHQCEEFGKNLPKYLKLSHCHEEKFHFFGIKDLRTNYNALIITTK